MSTDVLNYHVDPDAPCKCDNCGTEHPASEAEPVQDLSVRLDPNGPAPVGECPNCNCLTYVLSPDRNSQMKHALTELLEQVYQMQRMFDDEDGEIAKAVARAELFT